MLRIGTQKIKELRIGTQKIKEAWVGATKVFSSGVAIGTLPVGSSVFMRVNNVLTEFLVVHQGNPDVNIYSTTFDNGTILLMKNIYENKQWNSSNLNDYANSTLNAYLNSDFLTLFDANIQAIIKQVKVPYRQGSGTSTTVTSGENGLSCKIFLLSGAEVGFARRDASYLPTNEGVKLNYFESGTGTSATKKRIGKLNGSAAGWWNRSPSCDDSRYASGVFSDGEPYHDYCSNSFGVRPALVLPNNTTINANNII